MRVIFLDIDGVLNCATHRRKKLCEGDYSVIIESQKVRLLKKLVMRTEATIVLTSSWRKYWMHEGSVDSAGKRIETALALDGLKILDKTPVLDSGSRSLEIEQWLKGKSYIDQYVILDDNDFLWSKSLRPHWVYCPGETGLTDSLIDSAENILSGKLFPSQECSDDQNRRFLNRLRMKATAFFRSKME